jgi:hypothetical protein
MNELVRRAIFVDGVEEGVDVRAQLTPVTAMPAGLLRASRSGIRAL